MKPNTRSIIGIAGGLSASAALIALTCAAESHQTCCEIRSDLVSVTQTMPPQVALGGEFVCTIQLKAVKCAANVVVTSHLSENASYVRSEPAATVDGRTLTWRIGNMDDGQSRTILFWFRADAEGTLASETSVAADPRLVTTTQCGTSVPSGVLLEVVDDPDPVGVGDTTKFTLKVTNQDTTRSLNKVAVVAVFSGETMPLSASDGGTVSGDKVSWPVVPILSPKASFTYTITARGVKAGESLLVVDATTAAPKDKVTVVESTTIY
jgi:hypothetical protein